MNNIFINNKYTKWYFNIIDNARNNIYLDYTENHHIIPKCMFTCFDSLSAINPDDTSNIIRLSAREHFICHILLPNMVESIFLKKKLFHALHAMRRANQSQPRHILSSWEFDYVRRNYSTSRKGVARPQTLAERQKRSNTLMGHKVSNETKEKIRKANTGRILSIEHRLKLIEARKNYPPQSIETRSKRSNTLMGHKVSNETKEKIRKANTGRKFSTEVNISKGDKFRNSMWIVKLDEKPIRINNTELDSYLSLGWKPGRIIKNK